MIHSFPYHNLIQRAKHYKTERTHYFIATFPNKRELQKVVLNHLSEI